MIDVCEYIKFVMKKKKMSNVELCKELNKIEERLGDKRTRPQNITNYLNKGWPFRPKILVKYECALGLAPYTLINMVSPVASKAGQKELKELMKKVSDIK